MASFNDIFAKAREYVTWDPCEETRSQIQRLIDSADTAALEGLIGKRQSFGTAGLRGPMCAGYAGLNYLVVLQTTQVQRVAVFVVLDIIIVPNVSGPHPVFTAPARSNRSSATRSSDRL